MAAAGHLPAHRRVYLALPGSPGLTTVCG